MKMVNTQGGLGNQFFQYAFAVALRNQNSDTVLLDTNWFKQSHKSSTHREYQLNLYNITIKPATKIQRFLCRRPLWSHIINPVLSLFHKQRISNIVNESECVPNYLTLHGNKYYTGYFINENYFKQYRDEILRDLTLKIPLDSKNQEMLNKIKNTNSVSLHIRRGDYLKLTDTVGLCSLKYYQTAVEYIAKHTQKPHFFLFSDDPDWVKENLKLKHPFTVVDINDGTYGYFDLELMKNCKHNINANSTFSWWASWLNTNPDKIVISPTASDIKLSK